MAVHTIHSNPVTSIDDIVFCRVLKVSFGGLTPDLLSGAAGEADSTAEAGRTADASILAISGEGAAMMQGWLVIE
jgi:hypothetical protein